MSKTERPAQTMVSASKAITSDCSEKQNSLIIQCKKKIEIGLCGCFIVPSEFKTSLSNQITGGPKVNLFEQDTFRSNIEGSQLPLIPRQCMQIC